MNYTQRPLTTVGPSRDYRGYGDYGIVNDQGDIIGEAFHEVGEGVTQDARANATLWSLAPDLVDAVCSLRALLNDKDQIRIQSCSLPAGLAYAGATARIDAILRTIGAIS